MRILMYGTPSAGDVVSIQAPVAPAPPGESQYTAEILIDDSSSGVTLLSEADGSDYEIREITSGGDLVIDSFDANFDDGSFILPSTVKVCYCDAVGDIPDPGQGGGEEGEGDEGGGEDGDGGEEGGEEEGP